MATGEHNDYVEEGTLGLLYLEPKQPASKEPIVDVFTMKMVAVLRKAVEPTHGYRGVHTCVCGVHSGSYDRIIENRFTTNTLAAHYLAYHRDEVPKKELQKVATLMSFGVMPESEELKPPGDKTYKKSELKYLVRALDLGHGSKSLSIQLKGRSP